MPVATRPPLRLGRSVGVAARFRQVHARDTPAHGSFAPCLKGRRPHRSQDFQRARCGAAARRMACVVWEWRCAQRRRWWLAAGTGTRMHHTDARAHGASLPRSASGLWRPSAPAMIRSRGDATSAVQLRPSHSLLQGAAPLSIGATHRAPTKPIT